MIGIIFDCDGVLVDSESAHFLSWQRALKKRGILWEQKDHCALCGHPGTFISNKLCDLFTLDSPDALLADKRNFYAELLAKGNPPFPYAIKLARQLASNKNQLDVKLAVASSAKKNEILSNLEHHALTDLFDVVVSGYEDLVHYKDADGVNKPKPYIYLHTAHLLGLNPSRCMAIEDSGPGILAAAEAGMMTFAIPNAFTKDHDFSLAKYLLEANQEIELLEFLEKIERAFS